jgi:hypothetical protein
MSMPFKTKRLLRRLVQMSPEEVRFRVRQQLWNRWETFRSRMKSSSYFAIEGFVAKGVLPRPGRFFFSAGDLSELTNVLWTRFPHVCADTIERAERICAHRFDLLGYCDLDFGSRIDWHFDPVNGKQVPLTRSYKIPYLESENLGDSKII